MSEKIKVVLGQLGSPASTKTKDVRAYLREFLGDPRVIDINPTLWKIILNLFILPFRPKRSAEAYGRILTNEGFPLITNTEKVAQGLKPHLDANIELDHAFLLSSPRIGDVFDAWEKEPIKDRAQRVFILPQFPQYAESTIGSVVDFVGKDLKKRVNIPSFTVVSSYHNSKAFIDHSVQVIQNDLDRHLNLDALIISFHGIPLRRVLDKKDLYFQHCLETFELIKTRLNTKVDIHMTFQSRFGSEIWLGPYTDQETLKLVESGKKNVAVYCPSFVVDCLETTDEIGHELKHEVDKRGGSLVHIPCLNASPLWLKDYAHFINVYVNGSEKERQDLFYKIDIEAKLKESLALQKGKSVEPLSAESKKILKIMFLTMFIDLVGFSLIFPMFPAMAKYYLEFDSANPILQGMMNFIGMIQSYQGGEVQMNTVVLFGGLLGALYSLLQFLAAPFWGALSDKVGRRPVMIISVFGLLLSYLLWFFAGNFTYLVVARIIGGFMAGNLAIASAVVSDVTDQRQRSKGMAVIGIAFALGFILGPAIGGISSMFNLLDYYPELNQIGVNPFSTPALVALILSVLNLIFLIFKFPETRKVGTSRDYERSINPVKLFRPLPFKGVNQTNLAYFFFISAFSGMEFTLTFLAVERLSYTSMQNAYMFIFIGLIIGLVQGGYVRRKAHQVGEKKMSLMGLTLLIPGLLILAFTHSNVGFYAGLFFLATGSAMVIPCLTSLVSFYTPQEKQGHSLGIFRSLGSLGRVVGPIYAAYSYWRFGATSAYVVGAVLIFLPLFLVKKLPTFEIKDHGQKV